MIGSRHLRSRIAFALAAFAAAGLMVGCGGGDVAPIDGSTAPPTTAAEASDGNRADDRPVAPDFTLTLQPEGEYVLADAAKPVYLVFWAEW